MGRDNRTVALCASQRSGDSQPAWNYTAEAATERALSALQRIDVVKRAFRELCHQLRSWPWAVCISALALVVSVYSTRGDSRGMKVAQRAYITYQVAVTNAETVIDFVTKDKDFFMTYQITVSNVGNTAAE